MLGDTIVRHAIVGILDQRVAARTIADTLPTIRTGDEEAVGKILYGYCGIGP